MDLKQVLKVQVWWCQLRIEPRNRIEYLHECLTFVIRHGSDRRRKIDAFTNGVGRFKIRNQSKYWWFK